METFAATATRIGNYWVMNAVSGELILEIGSTTDSEIRSMWVADLFNRYDGFQNWKRTYAMGDEDLLLTATMMVKQLYNDAWEVRVWEQSANGPWCFYIMTEEEPGCCRYDMKAQGFASKRSALMTLKSGLEAALITLDPLPQRAYELDLLRS